jgi:hypothetical protein
MILNITILNIQKYAFQILDIFYGKGIIIYNLMPKLGISYLVENWIM